jgi:RNA polymerase sigma-70 factor (ECF subfamily)
MASATLEADATRMLVSQAQDGSRSAADRLVRQHEGWVRSVIYAVCGRADLIDDVAQQVWIQAWQRLGTLKDPQRLRSWLYAIARHAAIDAGMARKRRRTVELERVEAGCRDERRPGPLGSVVGGELRRTLLQAIEGLPALYREPFVLRHLEDWSYAEIGELLGMPVETVETRLVRARRLLRECLKGRVEK